MADMSLSSLVADLKASLFDAAGLFTAEDDADFKRFLAQALPDMQWKSPLTKLSEVTLAPGVSTYPVVAEDFAGFKVDLWRDVGRLPRPWEPGYPGALPRVSAQHGATGWELVFESPPTAAMLTWLGSSFRFYYFAQHAIGEQSADTTLDEGDRGLLLLRAQAEAMLALAVRNAGKPVQLRDGLSGAPRNSTPAALHQVLLRTFMEAR